MREQLQNVGLFRWHKVFSDLQVGICIVLVKCCKNYGFGFGVSLLWLDWRGFELVSGM
ncbi:MAG: hypothetical protein K9G31_03160 [Crocinitomicaceae bacterium]|nr:hypothetical protein [Crocinitomicaceae bacterium]MCF8444761.1 hypothetical protein [Crocinitomicaceae bacterium]